MDAIAVRTMTDYGMKRIEIYPYGDKGFQPHIAIDFTHFDRDGRLVNQEFGEITFSIGLTRANTEEAKRFADCMRYAVDAAQRSPRPEWPSELAQAFSTIA